MSNSGETSGDRSGGQEGPEPPPLSDEAQKQWAEYALARFESAENRVKEFRNWARQLAAALAVIIGLEVNLITKVFDSKPLLSDIYPPLALLVLFGAAAFKTILIFRIFPLGYAPRELMGPEGPKLMRVLLVGKDEREAREVIARYYAKACDGQPGHEGLHSLAEGLGESLKKLSLQAALSMSLLVIGTLILAGGRLLSRPAAYDPLIVVQQPKSPPPVPPPTAPPPATPVKSPSLPTPTKGAPLHEGTQKKK